ncbi:Tfp pilus assembly protein PilE [Cupriavidus gilardii CR3]|uniref:Prepilin-type N-terminal cleavage/methylation domain-containing protein n=1 Tax=Cupriavidus gilardii TaxID=82541 RepID=A0A849BAU3_9BURK|nr:prepilin-type N-terminal cleavage/methylation domain-containing protein [Cupriavidus gilardii]ALD89805.1 Tfp pilus assembly protein PilE [Cupriavidus gilardii CR3]QQE07393.1 prepilin-type N-terminal cleavage/methylation domain-containing protein [Cupriavidus sp. ISTL7]KAB0598814.1 prepilin-type N-terminal cleavage/methylation domain-containing protein [Cupriavidus gilardii]MCT9015342.1 prepilin-type N-terminal cleavage/methylation domain-containing protein [Cupriavidus gilardii]MCT9055112.1
MIVPRPAAFTLIELLVAITIAAIVAGLAAASWHRHLQRSWRVQARTAMIAAMLELQRHAMARGSFADDGGRRPAGTWPQWLPAPPARPQYRLAALPCTDAGLDRCIELHAAPQWPDPACGTLILRSGGEWLIESADMAGPVPWPAGC